MHNLHIITLIHNKNDLEGAAELALREIEDWGNENNWRDWDIVISESGKYIINDAFRTSWLDKDLLKSGEIDYAISYIYDNLIVSTPHYKDSFDKIRCSNNIEKEHKYDIYQAYKYLKELFNFVQITDNIWELNYMSFEYDEPGITCMVNPDYNKDLEERYIVFIDIHS